MKRETLRHPKTFDLMARLQCDRPTALGYLQLLWDYTGEVAPQGDIGKWPNPVVAKACDWPGEPDEFIAAMIGAGWIDPVDDADARLLIHDWPDHCEGFVKAKLKRAEKTFHPLYCSIATPSQHRHDTVTTVTPLSHPIPSKPIPSNPIPSANADSSPNPAELEKTLIAQWNATKGVRKTQDPTLTDKRRRAFRARIKKRNWLDDYPKALAKFPLKCTRDDSDGWVPDLEWFLKPDSVTKILEGKYDWTKTNKGQSSRTGGPVQSDSPARVHERYGKS